MGQSSYQILAEDAQGEIVVKKSRFLAHLTKVETEEEADAFVRSMKKQYWDARHNCSAFVIGSQNEITRCSDDGEPSGTAGRPMLEVLTGSGLHDTAAVVTRYFGGVLLGTGGLVRAYQSAVKEALSNAHLLTMRLCVPLEIRIPYPCLDRVKGMLEREGACLDIAYSEEVCIKAEVPAEKKDAVLVALVDETSGAARCKAGDARMAAV